MSKDRGSFSSPAVVVALITLAAVVLSWGVINVVVGAQEGGSQPSLTQATDSVTFDAEFQAEEQAPKVMTRWAKASVGSESLQTNGIGGVITEPETRKSESWNNIPLSVSGGEAKYAANACIQGGGIGPNGFCEQDGRIEDLQGEMVAGASISKGDFSYLVSRSLLGLGLNGSTVSLSTQGTISTGVRCYVDGGNVPKWEADKPQGTVAHGTSTTLGLITADGSFSLQDIGNGDTHIVRNPMNSLLGTGYSYAKATPRWGLSLDELSVYSEVELQFRVENRALLNSFDSGWHIVKFRSECGFTMSEQQSVSPLQASPQPRVASPTLDDPTVTSATGSPRISGFTTEDTLMLQGMEYHLLATRELGAFDRREIEAVLDEIAESGDVEGNNWKLFDARAAGEPVPVIEIELADGVVVQVRPIVDGVALPLPDVIPTTSVTPTTSAPAPPTPATSSPSTSATAPPEGDDDE